MKDNPSNTIPRLDRLTLKFRDPQVEAAYQDTYPHGMRNLTRLGLGLGALLVTVFGVIDRPADAAIAWQAWSLRAVIVAVLLALLAISHTDFFYRNMQRIVAAGSVLVMVGLGVIYSMTPEMLTEQYVGFIVVMVATYTVLALQFSYVLWISALLLVIFPVLIFVTQGQATSGIYAGIPVYLLSALILVVTGSWMTDRQRRIGFYMRQQLVAEREESRRLALHDHLTGLANRRLLMERLALAVARDRRSGSCSVVMFLDLDDFKRVNDRFGHQAGDELLVEIATRLQSVVREVDTLARVGGDEFVIVFEDVKSRDSADLLAERVRAQFSQPVEIDSHRVNVAASIGVAVHPDDGETPDELLNAADGAMYIAKKRKGTNFIFHTAA